MRAGQTSRRASHGQAGTVAAPAWRQAATTPASAPADRPQAGWTRDEYAFLTQSCLDQATLERAFALAERLDVSPHHVLIANGWIGEADYYRALAQVCGTSLVETEQTRTLRPLDPQAGPRACLRSGLLRQVRRGASGLVITPASARPLDMRKTLLRHFGPRPRLSMATPGQVREVVLRSFAARLLGNAIHGLSRRYPDEMAAAGVTSVQTLLIAVAAALALAGGVLAPVETLRLLAGLATLFFALVVCLRIAACVTLVSAVPRSLLRRRRERIADAELPVYTLLVPLFRERNMLPGLLRALARLDYPALGSKRTNLTSNSVSSDGGMPH